MAAAPSIDIARVLHATPLLGRASIAGIEHLASESSLRTLDRNEVLAQEGAPARGCAVVVTGRLSVYHLGADGRKLLFETAEAGQPVAAVAAFAGGRYPAWIEATEPTSIVWVPREPLFELIDSEPAVARSVVTDLANRVVNFTAVATSLSLDVPARVARFVFQRSLAVGRTSADGLFVDLGMSKGELAQSLGTVPETLSRALAKLKAEGLLEVRGRDVVVLDVGGLARRGEGLEE